MLLDLDDERDRFVVLFALRDYVKKWDFVLSDSERKRVERLVGLVEELS